MAAACRRARELDAATCPEIVGTGAANTGNAMATEVSLRAVVDEMDLPNDEWIV